MAVLVTLDVSQVSDLDAKIRRTLSQLPRRIANRRNRTLSRDRDFHPYSSLLAFEQLLYLLQLLSAHPGAGELYREDPDRLRNLLGEGADISDLQGEVDELSRLLSHFHHPIYGEKKAIARNLEWLESNGFLATEPMAVPLAVPSQDVPATPVHAYSDREPFVRLMETLRFISHHPFDTRGEPALESLSRSLHERGILQGTIQACTANLRKDIERIFKPYRLLSNRRHRRGYFLGTGIFSQSQLLQLHKILAGQAKSLDDPLALDLLNALDDRLHWSHISSQRFYPVRAIYNHMIVDRDRLSPQALVNSIDRLEREIEVGQCLELGRFPGVGSFGTEPESFFKAWPVQIAFHNIAWYLGFELASGEQEGLLQFERIDRLFRGRPCSQRRERRLQEKALKKLRQLYEASGGLYLGDNAVRQRQWLEGEREESGVRLELWFGDRAYRFVCEGDRRFPREQVRFSPLPNSPRSEKSRAFSLAPTGDARHPHRMEVCLPDWAWQNVDLRRWIMGFETDVKVASPREWAFELGKALKQTASLYNDSDIDIGDSDRSVKIGNSHI
jgi:hypothetical protein